MGDVILQRVVFPRRQHLAKLYYGYQNPRPLEVPDPVPIDRRSITLQRGTSFHTNTYFNSVFEFYWRAHTTVNRICLRVWVTGKGTIELCQTGPHREVHMLLSVAFDCHGEMLELDLQNPEVEMRPLGSVFFKITPRSEQVTLHRGEWVARDVSPKPVRIVAGYCTFNREGYLLRNVNDLCSEAEVAQHLAKVVVVDQGSNKVRDHPEYARLSAAAVDKLSLVEQGNFGGAGGFTRCMLEAGRTAGATHVLLMDDDAIIEPESVHRAATFQSLAREEIGVGGQMLDLQQPLQLYETAGQILFSQILMGPQVHGVRVDRTHSLQMLHRIYATYAGWWFFCLPLSLLTRHGLPLPLFIRGDDIEYGLRLTKAGVQSVMLPGVAVWHEPFYAKRRNWLAYYDQRNMFAVGAVHFPSSRWSLARLMLVRLLKSLLTMDYYGAWLLCRAIEDYRRGPDLLDADPQHIHRQLLDERKTYPLEKVSRNFAFPVTTPPVRGRIKRLLQIGLGLFRGLFRRSTPASTPITTAIDWRDENWLTLAPMNVVAIDDPFSDAYVVLRRNRGAFWRLLGRGLWAVLRTVIAHGRILRRWQAAFARLTTSEFWHRYLGVARQDEAEASRRRTAA